MYKMASEAWELDETTKLVHTKRNEKESSSTWRRSGQRSHKTDWEGATSERRVDPSAQACEPDEGGHQVEPEEERSPYIVATQVIKGPDHTQFWMAI